MKPFVAQYKLLFLFSWICLYLIFPAWALPISVTARAAVFVGLITFFSLSTHLMNRWFNALIIDKPAIVMPVAWAKHVKSNLWLIIICCIAVILHIRYLFFPILILGDETIHLVNGLWIYEFINTKWHVFFQISFWVMIGLMILLRRKKVMGIFKINSMDRSVSGVTENKTIKYVIVFLSGAFLVAYFLLLRNLPYLPSLIRYPPVSKFLYFLTYSAFGINHIFPRIIQLIFYLLCAVYLYRTINLFHERETALIGAAIYLFLPIAFLYAHLGELESGTICLIVVTSYYFLRFIKERNNRDLLLTVYLIGIGFLYKDPVFLVFPVCFIFLIFQKTKKHEVHSWLHLKILSLALVSVIPWMIITKVFSWRNYTFQMSNVSSLDSKIVPYFLLMASNLSGIVFILFVVSVFYVCFFKRNTLTIFFGLLFIVYYFFIVSDMGSLSPRFSLAFYPTITVFLSLFISRVIQFIKWRHAFKLCTVVLTIYLIIISAVPPLNNNFLAIENIKLHYYPSDKAMMWVKDNVKDGEKVLTIRMLTAKFYQLKYAIDRDKIVDLRYSFDEIDTPEKLIAFYKKHNISYIMFPYSPTYNWRADILEYLADNPDKEFEEVVKYSVDENNIYIYKLNKS